MKRQKLTVEPRKVLGKKVKKLRREGVLPANIYGKNIKSIAVQIPLKEFEKIHKEVGETGLIDLELKGELKPVLIHNVQFDHITDLPLHTDFYQVNLKEKVKTAVPLILVGEAKAVTEKIGILLQPLSEVEVEALPEDLPENIEVKVDHLANIDEQITVGDLKAPQGVTVHTDPSQVIVKVTELVSKEAEEQAAAEAAAAAEAKAETAEGEAPVEGAEAEAGAKPEEAKTEEVKKDETKKEDQA
ncbi:MAG: 50S ribosomal protein L25 [Patescibacteria group bacterium]|nr:50S ribosomal protein L25 [Patescibacteria group bacterium]